MTCHNCGYKFPKENKDFNFPSGSACKFYQDVLMMRNKEFYHNKFTRYLIKALYVPSTKFKFIKLIRGIIFSVAHYRELELSHNYKNAYKGKN